MFAGIPFLLLLTQAAGVPPEWEVKPRAQQIVAEARQLLPVIERIQPNDWKETSQASVYLERISAMQAAVPILEASAAKLSEKPDRMTRTLELLMEADAFLSNASALSGGVRRYGNPAIADLLDAAIREGSAGREWLRQYALALAAQREQEWEVAAAEAQRCRAELARPGARPAAPKKP